MNISSVDNIDYIYNCDPSSPLDQACTQQSRGLCLGYANLF